MNYSGVLGSFSMTSALLALQIGRSGVPRTKAKNVNYMALCFLPVLTFISLIPCSFAFSQAASTAFHPIAFIWGHAVFCKFSIVPTSGFFILSAYPAAWCVAKKELLEVDQTRSGDAQTSISRACNLLPAKDIVPSVPLYRKSTNEENRLLKDHCLLFRLSQLEAVKDEEILWGEVERSEMEEKGGERFYERR